MDLNKGVNELEVYHKQLMDMLPTNLQKMVGESISRMSATNSPEELEKLKNEELKKIEDVCKDSSKGS